MLHFLTKLFQRQGVYRKYGGRAPEYTQQGDIAKDIRDVNTSVRDSLKSLLDYVNQHDFTV